MAEALHLGDIEVDVIQKDIKNVHLSVYPPDGRVRVSAPSYMSLDTIRVFAISKLNWIKGEQRKLREQERETPREYLNRESHLVWGRRRLLKVSECECVPRVELEHDALMLTIRPGASEVKRQTVVSQWFREQVKAAAPPLIAKWAPRMGVEVGRLFVRQMKTKWGSCNPDSGSIRLNSELAKKPPKCLEYIVVHELAHLIERTHNERFLAVMNEHMPRWALYRDELNAAPLAHESWGY